MNDNVKTGIQIFKILLEKGQMDKNEHGDLFIEYMNSDVQDVLNEFEEEMDCKIIKINNTIYLLPNHDNNLLGFMNKDFREWIGANATLTDVFLAYYIVIFILFKFYGGKNKNIKQTDYIRIMSLLTEIDNRFDTILSENTDSVILTEERLGINLIRIAETWRQKITHEENKRTTKHGTVLRICTLLEQEKLIRIMDDKREIRPTKKLDDIMTYYFLNDNRIDEINSIFKTEGNVNASN